MKKSKVFLFVFMLFFLVNISYCQITKKSENTIITLNDSCKLAIEISEFDSTLNKIEKCKILNWEGVCLINGKLVFGTDFEIPSTILEKAYLYFHDQIIKLDVSSMYDPNGLSLIPNKDQFEIRETEGGFFLTGNFSDGAGAYTVIWKIVKDKSLRVFIGGSYNQ